MSRVIPIEDWAVGPNGFSYPKNLKQLEAMARTGQIYPPAMKDGGLWVVYEDAKFIGKQKKAKISQTLPPKARKLVERSLNGKTT